MLDSSHDHIDIAPEESPILEALEQFAQFVDETYDSPHDHSIFWEGNPSRIAVRSVGRVLCKWRHAIKPNRPPNALVVRLARRLPTVLTAVTEHPKRVLQRRRAMEPIHRLRELDSTCVRWLVRQPGNNVAEKSGHRRAVLAVQRFESVDTMENRVVRDLLRRCIRLSNTYLKLHRDKFPDHKWIGMTQDFLKLCRRLEALPHLQDVSTLPSLPKPNYVLLHETRYQQIWRSYMEVIRQQRRRQQLWTYRHQAFADMVSIAWMQSASSRLENRLLRKSAHRFELRIRETPLRGTFFDWSAVPPIWEASDGSGFFIGPKRVGYSLANSIATLPSAYAQSLGDHPDFDGEAVVVSWSGNRLKFACLDIHFAPEQGDSSPESKNLNTVDLRLVDGADRRLLVSHSVPLNLIEHPRHLDRIHEQWCDL